MDKPKYNVSDEEMDSLVKALDEMLDEEEPDFYGDLKEAAWNVLHENPGYGFDEWVQTLMEEYPAEVVDAIGSHPAETYASLADMWDSEDYEDSGTGECHTFKDWAEYFATDRSVELYDLLVEAKGKIRRLEARKSQNSTNPSTEHTKSGRGANLKELRVFYPRIIKPN